MKKYYISIFIVLIFISLTALTAADDYDQLSMAVMMNDTQSLKNFLDNGADPNAKDSDGTTIMHLASFAGNLESVELLSNYGADINARDNEGFSFR